MKTKEEILAQIDRIKDIAQQHVNSKEDKDTRFVEIKGYQIELLQWMLSGDDYIDDICKLLQEDYEKVLKINPNVATGVFRALFIIKEYLEKRK